LTITVAVAVAVAVAVGRLGRRVADDGLGGGRCKPCQNLANIRLPGTAAATVLNTTPAAGAAEPKVTR